MSQPPKNRVLLLNDDYAVKREVWRYLDPRWTWTRSYALRQHGYNFQEIATAMGRRGESTARTYVKRGVEESHLSTLYQRLSVRARHILTSNKIWKDMPTHMAVNKARQMIAEIKDGRYPCGHRVAKKTLHEILNVLDDFA